MRVDTQTGRLNAASFYPTEHCDVRDDPQNLALLV